MTQIRGTQDIYMSRADTVNLGINLMRKDGDCISDYEMADREYVVFKIWDEAYHRVIGTLESEIGTSIINITPEFTAHLCGNYKYSVDLIYANGEKETVIGRSGNSTPKFIVLEA